MEWAIEENKNKTEKSNQEQEWLRNKMQYTIIVEKMVLKVK